MAVSGGGRCRRVDGGGREQRYVGDCQEPGCGGAPKALCGWRDGMHFASTWWGGRRERADRSRHPCGRFTRTSVWSGGGGVGRSCRGAKGDEIQSHLRMVGSELRTKRKRA